MTDSAGKVKVVQQEEIEHGIGSAFYALGPFGMKGQHRPVMTCLCGFSTSWQESWEDAGAALDDHLAKVFSQ